MGINEIALNYINSPIISEAKEKRALKSFKTRKAMINAYERLVIKYKEVKEIVEDLRAQGASLQKKFDFQKERMNNLKNEMKNIRDQLNKMDDLEEEKEKKAEESAEANQEPKETETSSQEE